MCSSVGDQMFFATSVLHVRVMQWDSTNLVEESVKRCNLIWESIEPEKVSLVLPSLYWYPLSFLRSSVISV